MLPLLMLFSTQAAYDVIDLGLGPGRNCTVAISPSGWIAASNGPRIVIWKEGRGTYLDNFGYSSVAGEGQQAHVNAVNDGGTAVGGVGSFAPLFMSGDSDSTGFIASGRRMRRIPGADAGEACGINRRGEIVGYSSKRGFYFYRGRMREIGTLSHAPSGNLSYAYAINDKGIVVGVTTVGKAPEFTDIRVFAMAGRRMRALPLSRHLQYPSAGAVNRNGTVVGSAVRTGGKNVGLIWRDGKLERLAPLVPLADTKAHGVNDAGVVVGESNGHAVLWRSGKVVDLNPLAPMSEGWVLIRAAGVSSRGWIVAIGRKAEMERPVLLRPR